MTNILVLDTETAPKMGYVWSLWKQNVGLNQLVKDTYILNWSAKWLGEDCIYSDALHYHKLYKKDPESDRAILKYLWKLVDKADIVVAHNGDGFDIPTMNSRFILNGMPPPSPFKTIDTLKIARQNFRFTSNRLDYLGQILGVGRKMETGGFELWRSVVLDRDSTQFDKMVEYCEQDVLLLEEVYQRLKVWAKGHPKIDLKHGDLEEMTCNVCGGTDIKKNGTYTTNAGRYQQYRCACGHNMRSRSSEKLTKEQRGNILTSV